MTRARSQANLPLFLGGRVQIWRLALLIVAATAFLWAVLIHVDPSDWDECVRKIAVPEQLGPESREALQGDYYACGQLVRGDLADVAVAAIFMAVAVQTVVSGAVEGMRRKGREATRLAAFVLVTIAAIAARTFFASFESVSTVSLALAICGAALVWANDTFADRQRMRSTPSIAVRSESDSRLLAHTCIYRLNNDEQEWVARAHEGASWHLLVPQQNDRHLIDALHRAIRGRPSGGAERASRTVRAALATSPSNPVVIDWGHTARVIVTAGPDGDRRVTVHLRGSGETEAGVEASLQLLSSQVHTCRRTGTCPSALASS